MSDEFNEWRGLLGDPRQSLSLDFTPMIEAMTRRPRRMREDVCRGCGAAYDLSATPALFCGRCYVNTRLYDHVPCTWLKDSFAVTVRNYFQKIARQSLEIEHQRAINPEYNGVAKFTSR